MRYNSYLLFHQYGANDEYIERSTYCLNDPIAIDGKLGFFCRGKNFVDCYYFQMIIIINSLAHRQMSCKWHRWSCLFTSCGDQKHVTICVLTPFLVVAKRGKKNLFSHFLPLSFISEICSAVTRCSSFSLLMWPKVMTATLWCVLLVVF